MKRLFRLLAVIVLVAAFFAVIAYGSQAIRPLPEGISFSGPMRPATDVKFLADTTYLDESGQRQSRQAIFDAIIGMIANAERFILVDMFLYNEFQGAKPERTRTLADELTDALVAKKRGLPTIEIVVISDPINTVYGGHVSEHFERLEAAGISIVITNLDALRDSNPLYAWLWRAFVRPFGNEAGGRVPNPFGAGRVSIRSYLRLFNFKANHRKVIIADDNGQLTGLVTSANPHDGSSAHTNVALKFSGAAAVDLLESEKAVLRLSDGPEVAYRPQVHNTQSDVSVRIVTEYRIEEAVLEALDAAGTGDRVDLAMFYLSDRDVVAALKRVHERGAELRVLLDPNKDAFGHQKNGIPNRQVAHEFVKAGLPLRWCNTNGEQCHSKLLIVRPTGKPATMILGSANLTRRNLENFNLETNVVVTVPADNAVVAKASAWFDAAWSNTPDRNLSLPYAEYAESSPLKTVLYRFMEASGFSSF